ncbi:hypothetical protein C8R46DRAFT_1057922 [Mycena filopes]|nr:hypothetical protein C8R46DRAFT_1057922 [Mycena filopes]
MPVPTPKRGRAYLPPLLDISSLVEFQGPFEICSDGRKRKRASAFHVNVLFEGEEKRCFLKIFPSDLANTLCFKAECEANGALNRLAYERLGAQAPNGVQSPEILAKHLALANHSLSWPLCYGYVAVEDPFFDPPRQPAQKRQKPAPVPKVHGLLFELFEDLVLLSPNDIDEEGVMEAKILRALAPIHTAHILHRDLEERTAWPDVGFRNIFLQTNGDPLILDFDHSQMLRDDEKDKTRLAEEEMQMKDLMGKALETRGRERGWGLSREARRLL